MNINQQCMYIRFYILNVYFCCFMCWWNILFYMCEYSDAIKLPKSYTPPPPPLGGQGLQIKSFLAGKSGKYRGRNEVAATVLIKTIKILWKYEIYFKERYKCKIFSAQSKCIANGISVQNVNVLPNQWSHLWNFPMHIAWNLLSPRQRSCKGI